MSDHVERAARLGLWLLPAYAVLLALGTLTHQPPVSDFDAYARYITTDVFLVSHLGGSIGGAALAILGALAVTVFIARGRAGRAAVVGLVLTVVSNVYMAASFGSASFVQPGIGRAHLAGVPGMADINSDTAYGPAFFATALSATALLAAAAIVLGVAVARTSPALRPYGTAYAVLVPLFAVTGFAFQPAQPWTGFALAAATAALAVRLPATTTVTGSGQGRRAVTRYRSTSAA
jgi:hypothetical protein